MNDGQLLKWAEFLATKYETNVSGWTYSRELGDLEFIRFKSDYTGYNHWIKRFKRAFDWKHLTGRDSFTKMFRTEKLRLKDQVISGLMWVRVSLKKEKNLPDGQINGILTQWEEDGEYIALFQPRVGIKVLEFIKANRGNEYAEAILREMHACAELSWPEKKEEDEG